MSQPPGRQFGKYTLIEPLAKGGMAETYRARFVGAAGVTKDVVIKKILPAYADDKSFVQMFINEAKIAATFSHGNIAQVFDFGEIDGEFFLAMELVDGRSLQEVLKRAKQIECEIPEPLALLICMRICEGLHYAHTRVGEDGHLLHIVHRDVTPENVIISYEGQVKLVDFGIAKARTAGRAETEPGTVKGKYLYFSPEQAAGQEVDHRTDVYSAGVVLYAMLCGRLPFEGQAVQVIHRLCSEPVPPPRSINKNISPALERILLRALARDRSERYQTAQAFGEALSSYLYHSEPSFSPTRLASFMAYIFEPLLKEEGRKVEVTDEFLKQLTAWRERTPAASTPPRRNTGIRRQEVEAAPRQEAPPPSEPISPQRRGSGVRLRQELEAALREADAPAALPAPQRRMTGTRSRVEMEAVRLEPEPPQEPTAELGDATLESVSQRTQVSLSMSPEPSGESTTPATIPVSVPLPSSEVTAPPRLRRGWALWVGGLLLIALSLGLWRLYATRSPELVEVQIFSHPTGASVVLDGEPVPGTTPLIVPEVTAGRRHRLKMSASGSWKPLELEFTPEAPGPYRIDLRLEALPQPSAPGSSGDARSLLGSLGVDARTHRFAVQGAVRHLPLDPGEKYNVWTEGSLTLDQELGQSTRSVLFVLQGADGAPVAGIAGPRSVTIERARALYALVLDPDPTNNAGTMILHVNAPSASQHFRLMLDARKNAVTIPAERKATLTGLSAGEGYRLSVRATEGSPGKVACVALLLQRAPDAVSGGHMLLEARESYDLSGADALECTFLGLGGEVPAGALQIDVRPGSRPYAPPL